MQSLYLLTNGILRYHPLPCRMKVCCAPFLSLFHFRSRCRLSIEKNCGNQCRNHVSETYTCAYCTSTWRTPYFFFKFMYKYIIYIKTQFLQQFVQLVVDIILSRITFPFISELSPKFFRKCHQSFVMSSFSFLST